MSLRIFIREHEPKNLTIETVHDVEAGYSKYNIDSLLDTRANPILQAIDGASIDKNKVILDRFGYKIYSDEISTGCKATLLLLYKHDIIVDTVECGHNALRTILLHCHDGYAIFPEPSNWDILDLEDAGQAGYVDFILGEKHYSSIEQTNKMNRDLR